MKINMALKLRIIEQYENQGNFARRAGVSEGYLSRVVNGKVTLRIPMKERWAKLLQTSTEAIWAEKEKVQE